MNDSSSTNRTATTDEFRRDDLETFPAGDGMELIYSPQLQHARLVPADISHLVQRCDAFRPLREHCRRFCEQNDLDTMHAEPLAASLKELAEDGFLLSRRQFIERCAHIGDPNDTPANIAAIVFPTRNRPTMLRRGVESFLDNTQRHGRTVEFVVADDSEHPQTREDSRGMLRELGRKSGAAFFYAGLEEKRRFADALIAESGCDPQLVEFALFNPLNSPRSTGANHNALALHLSGKAFLSADDDVICRLASPPDARTEGAAFFSIADPTAHWFFPNPDAAVNAAPPLDVDIVAAHEKLLGRNLGECVAELSPDGAVDTEKMGDDFLRRLRGGRGKVLATFTGHVGDPGVGSTLPYLWTDGETFKRLTVDEKRFGEAMTQRAVLRCAQRHSIGGANVTMNMCMGFDRRELMPPFMPVQRALDDLMGKVLWHLYPECFFGHLPFTVTHLPEQPRTLPMEGPWRRAHGTYTAEILAWCCQSFETRLAAENRAGRLRALGRHLMEMGSMPLAEFEDFVRRRFFAERSGRLAHLEYRLAESDGRAPYWEDALRDYVESVRDYLAQKECARATDLVKDFGEEKGRAMMPLLTRNFGELLLAWQALEEASVRLREKEIHVAQLLA